MLKFHKLAEKKSSKVLNKKLNDFIRNINA